MNEQTDEWGGFGQPIFDDPQARALARVGVIDVGSNSVRLVVFDGAARSPAYFFNEKVMCGLGSGFAETGRLNPEGRDRALSALRRFARLTHAMGASPVTTVATAAMREAADGPAFRAQVERETGLKVWIVDGGEEARLTAQGVLLGWPGAEGLVCDIGGSSMELARIAGGRVGWRMSTPLGPLRLQGLKDAAAVKAEIKRTLEPVVRDMGAAPDRLFLVGGSWRAIARIDMARRDYPLQVLHEYRIPPDELRATLKLIEETGTDELRARTGIGESRMSLVPLAATVLRQLVKAVGPREIAISSYGIREGLLYEQMPQRLRDRDPLIEACRFAEQKDARLPGFGRALLRFIGPIFADAPQARQRIVRAACLLHDVSWRTHPDYRHEACFDNATRANLGGMTHQDRVFLAVALLHRYKNSRAGTRMEGVLGILPEADIAEAEILGRALRFGAMFSAETPDAQATIRWDSARRHLDLHLTEAGDDLFGEVAQSRFGALVSALGATSSVTRPDG